MRHELTGIRSMSMQAAALIGASILLTAAGAAPTATPWPVDSLHHVQLDIETAQGARTTLAETAGHVRIATMFYASCPMACPLIIDALRSIDRQLSARERKALRMLLVTLDPERDTPAALGGLAALRGIDESRWTLGRASPSDTRKLAAALGIRYRRLDDGNFDHSSELVLLDAQGRVLARSTALRVDPAFLDVLRTALEAGPTGAGGSAR
jgi:protein SCO1/2